MKRLRAPLFPPARRLLLGTISSPCRLSAVACAVASALVFTTGCGRAGFDRLDCVAGDEACAGTDPTTDRDGDLIPDDSDSDPDNPRVCGDRDRDGCDDCSSGTFDVINDGPNQDGDVVCDKTESCVGGGRAVAVTVDGQLLYSDDGGLTWMSAADAPRSAPLTGVAYGLGRFVAVGHEGTVLYSDDGATWTPASLSGASDTIDFTAVLHAEAGWWAIVGKNGSVGLSVDNAATWVVAAGALGDGDLTDLAYDLDRRRWLVLDATHGTVHSAILSDAPTWSESNPGASDMLAGIAADESVWLAVDRGGIAYRSLNRGGSWTPSVDMAGDWSEIKVGAAQRSFVVTASPSSSLGGNDDRAVVFGSDAGDSWQTLVEVPQAQVSGQVYDCGNGRQYFATRDGRVFDYALGDISVSAAKAADAAITGIAVNADGAVRAQVIRAAANCTLTRFPANASVPRRIHRIDLRPGASGQPVVLGTQTIVSYRLYIQARLRIRTAGDYSFRLVLGNSDVAELSIDDNVIIGGGSCYRSREGTVPALSEGVHDLEIFFGDDGQDDRLTLEYLGPDTGGDYIIVPPYAFAPE